MSRSKFNPAHNDLRLIDREVQTPVRTYRSPDGRRVTLIATNHMADRDYLVRIFAIASGLEQQGAVVFAEGSKLDENELEQAAPEELEAMLAAVRGNQITSWHASQWGWVNQTEHRTYAASWRGHDLTVLDVIRGVGPAKMLKNARRALMVLDRNTGRVNPLFRIMVTAMYVQWARRRKRGPLDDVLVDTRNAVLLAALHDTEQDAVVVWGVDHLEGLEADLTSRGYSVDGEDQWVTTVRLQAWPVLLRDLLTGRRPDTPRPPKLTSEAVAAYLDMTKSPEGRAMAAACLDTMSGKK